MVSRNVDVWGTPLVLGLAALVMMGASACSRRSPPGPATAAAESGGATGAASAAPVVYDPTKLLENGVPAAEVFDKEPRSPTWAQAAELVVGDAMGRDLKAMVPEAGVVIKCRTLSCLVGIDAPAEKREAALAVTKFLMLAPWVVDLDPEEDGTLRWLFFQEPRFADPKTFAEWFQEARRRTLANIREGKTPNPFPVPIEQVPGT
jgi:hypothetical protein